MAFLIVAPVFLFLFGVIGGFAAAIAEGGHEDHPLWLNALVAAAVSVVLGGVSPDSRMESSSLANPIVTFAGALAVWSVWRHRGGSGRPPSRRPQHR